MAMALAMTMTRLACYPDCCRSTSGLSSLWWNFERLKSKDSTNSSAQLIKGQRSISVWGSSPFLRGDRLRSVVLKCTGASSMPIHTWHLIWNKIWSSSVYWLFKNWLASKHPKKSLTLTVNHWFDKSLRGWRVWTKGPVNSSYATRARASICTAGRRSGMAVQVRNRHHSWAAVMC